MPLKRLSKISTLFNKMITEKPLKFPLIPQKIWTFRKCPPEPVERRSSSERGAYSYSYGFATPCILQEWSLSVCYELMGRDERSKAAMQINHLSVLQWERRQEISLEHYNHMATPFNSTQSRRGWWGLSSISDGKMSNKNGHVCRTLHTFLMYQY